MVRQLKRGQYQDAPVLSSIIEDGLNREARLNYIPCHEQSVQATSLSGTRARHYSGNLR